MGWVAIESPTQEMMDEVMARAKADVGPCHDCGAKPGKKHTRNCDVARCLVCRGQRLQCDCKGGGGDVWTGLWPGTEDAYKLKLLCRWEGAPPLPGWAEDNRPRFDLNRWVEIEAVRSQKEKIEPWVVKVTPDKPTKEGVYFCQFHRNFEPVMCQVIKKSGKLWLKTKKTTRLLSQVKAYCFSGNLMRKEKL